MWSTVVELFRNYMGTGLIVVWFVVCLVYLFLREQDRGRRVLFLYVPAALFLLFFNPLFMRIVYGIIGAEIYYRILWLMPITIVIAYTIVHVYQSIKGRTAILFLAVSVLLISLSGKFIYKNVYFTKAENLYHMPVAVVQICDLIEVEGREVMAVFPQELIPFVRQYSPLVCMPYGREMLIESWGNSSEFYDAMEAAVLDAKKLTEMSKNHNCHYMIIREQAEVDGDFEEYGFLEFAKTEGYIIYRDPSMDLSY